MAALATLLTVCGVQRGACAQTEIPEAALTLEETRVSAGSFLPLDPFHAGLAIGSGVGWMTERAAQQHGLGEAGATFHMSLVAEALDVASVAFGFGTIFVSDNDSFQQRVVPLGSDPAAEGVEVESALDIYIFTLSGGLRSPDLSLVEWYGGTRAYLSVFMRYGRAWLSGGRHIHMCIDCFESDVKLADGSILESGVMIGEKAGNGIGLSFIVGYRHYLTGSAAGELQLALALWYW